MCNQRQTRTTSLIASLVIFSLFALTLLGSKTALAQLGSVPIFGQASNEGPVSISAEDGIEWDRDNRVYRARGNAQATQGSFFVIANQIEAFYRDGTDNGNKIWKVIAKGDVFAKSEDDEVYGDQAIYLIDDEHLILTGSNIILNSSRGRLTANEKIEYKSKEKVAIATGDAIVIQNKNRVMADKLTAHMNKDAANDGKQQITFIEAEGDVRISSGQGFAQAEQADYDVIKEYATLAGNVRLTQGQNQLNGKYAEVDMKKGTSRLLANKPGTQSTSGKKNRVYILLDPNSTDAPVINSQ